MGAVNYDPRGVVSLLPQAPSTKPSRHAAPPQEGHHTREQASPEKPEVHPEQEPNGAAQQNNMAYLDSDMTDIILKTIRDK